MNCFFSAYNFIIQIKSLCFELAPLWQTRRSNDIMFKRLTDENFHAFSVSAKDASCSHHATQSSCHAGTLPVKGHDNDCNHRKTGSKTFSMRVQYVYVTHQSLFEYDYSNYSHSNLPNCPDSCVRAMVTND